MSNKVYVEAPDWKLRCEKIKKAYPHNFESLNLDRIIFLKELETEPKKFAVTKKIDPVYKVRHPEADYIMIFFESVITKADFKEAHRNVLCMHELMHVDPEGEKLIRHDVEEHFMLGITVGIDWDHNPNLEDPLVTKLEIKKSVTV